MCYGNPGAMLDDILRVRKLQPDEHGHTALENFEHFCSYSGCHPQSIGEEAFAWAKLAYVRAQLPPASAVPEALDETAADKLDLIRRNATTVRC
ncbi:conserved hypothetical protein [Burkholderia sp. 8Y]|uniref:hypothetical protein n=1 Tax=Burkholderia sp. 8Y TaxID=2653133 RepID=UPI0012F04E87|nr:hypothetical protein [Burkholderia sp. 8Y]VXC84351.1 conserved hypothetical protein [Burkholderia sp. 8Y]